MALFSTFAKDKVLEIIDKRAQMIRIQEQLLQLAESKEIQMNEQEENLSENEFLQKAIEKYKEMNNGNISEEEIEAIKNAVKNHYASKQNQAQEELWS